MKILVIGSKGFIGSHLLMYLRQQRLEAWGCDIISDPTDPYYFHYDGVDVNFEKLFELTGFTHCLNCSGSASVPFSFQQPASDFNLNTAQVFGLLDAIRKHAPECSFIQLSSAAVYGNPDTLPVRENSTTQPVSIYGFHKRMAEEICEEFHRFFNAKVLTVRIFSAYGPGLKKQLFWDLYTKAKNNTNIELFGTGNESRDFIHVEDVVLSLALLMQKGDYANSYYNLASGQETTVKNAATCFYNAFNPSVKINFTGTNRQGDPERWRADISKMNALGFSPKYSFEDGIKMYADWLKQSETN